MLPAWLGWETALSNALARGQADLLAQMREQWPFFRTRIDMLEMVLAKADAQIAEAYDQRLVQPRLLPLGAHLRDLLSQSCQVVLGLTGQQVLLAHSPETLEFIRLRNTYLDPLHRLQAELLARSRSRRSRSGQPAGAGLAGHRGRYCRRVAQHRLNCPGALGKGCACRARGGQGWLVAPGATSTPAGRNWRVPATLGRLSGGGRCVS